MATCGICLELLNNENSTRNGIEHTTCAHAFHTECLAKWRASGQSASAQCPMCRTVIAPAVATPSIAPTSVRALSERERAVAPTVPVGSWAHTPPAAPIASSLVSTRSVQEREHLERLERRERAAALQRRMDSYRSSVFTPSGRPFESLPVVNGDQLREALKENKRAIGGFVRTEY